MRLRWTGRYYDGCTAAAEPVAVVLAPTGVRIEREDGSSLWWAYEDLRQSQGFHRGEPVRLERREGTSEALVVEEEGFLDAVGALAPQAARRFAPPARGAWRLWRTLALAAGALIAGAGIYVWGIPTLAARAAARVPLEWEERLGEAVRDGLLAQSGHCADSLAIGAVERIVAQLGVAAASPYTFRVAVSADDVPNAFAAPGGFIVVNRGLLRVTRRPEELAGVLAHEMQHVLQQHGTQAVLRQVPVRLVLATAAGDVPGQSHTIQALGTLGSLRYQRRDEAEADSLGLALLSAAGVDPRGMPDFFRTLEREAADVPSGLAYLSTHPRTADRTTRMDALAGARPARPARPLLPSVRWERVRNGCGGPAV